MGGQHRKGVAMLCVHRSTSLSISIAFIFLVYVASWSNGQHDPPQRLKPVFKEVKALMLDKNEFLLRILKANNINLQANRGIIGYDPEICRNLQKEIELPSGRKASFGEILAASRYVELQHIVKQRAERTKQSVDFEKKSSSQPADPHHITYENAFIDLYQELGQHYPCFRLKGIDWTAVGEELLPRAKEVKTDAEFGFLVMELVARLEDSHARVINGTAKLPVPPIPRWDPGFACLMDDGDKPVVYYVDKDGPAQDAGVQVGMTILSVNGVPSKRAIEECMKQMRQYSGWSSDRYLRYQAARWFIRQKDRGTKVELKMQGQDGEARTCQLPAMMGGRYLPRLPVPIPGISDSANVSWAILDDKIGYLYVRRIRRDLIEKLDRAVKELQKARGLIIDVRGNSGGGFDARRAHRNFSLEDGREPLRPRFKGPMALLIDSRCISAGEGWASWFVAHSRTRIFGETTAGALSRKKTYTLGNGLYKVIFPVKAYRGFLDRPIERLDLIPDVKVKQNAQDLAMGKDTALDTAKNYLLGKIDRD